MPRIKMKAAEYAVDDFLKAVRVGRAEQDIRQYELAERMGLHATTLCEKLKSPERMTVLDLRGLYRAKVVTEEDVMRFIRADMKK